MTPIPVREWRIRPISLADPAACVAIVCLVLFGEIILARLWASLGVFSQLNVIFDVDASTSRSDFASGWRSNRFDHPLLAYSIAPLIKLVTALASFAGVADRSAAVREGLAVYVAPLCAALKSGCFYVVFRGLDESIAVASLEALVAALAFSSVVFGATPGTYALTGWWLSVLTLLAVASGGRSTLRGPMLWIAAGVAAIGVTVSNVIHLGFLNAAARVSRGTSLVRGVSQAAVFSGAVLVLTVFAGYLLDARRGNPEALSRSVAHWRSFVAEYTPPVREGVENLQRFPELLARTFIPTSPRRAENKAAVQEGDPIQFELSYNGMAFGWMSLGLTAIGLCLMGGGVVAYRLGGAWRLVGVASAASVLTYGGLYSCFGLNSFLYSQYWQVPATILVGAWFRLLGARSRTLLAFVLTATVFGLFIGDLVVLHDITRNIENVRADR